MPASVNLPGFITRPAPVTIFRLVAIGLFEVFGMVIRSDDKGRIVGLQLVEVLQLVDEIASSSQAVLALHFNRAIFGEFGLAHLLQTSAPGFKTSFCLSIYMVAQAAPLLSRS